MNFEIFYKDLETQLTDLVNKYFRKYRKAALSDVHEYMTVSRGRLQDYSRMIEVGMITPKELDFLSESLKENAVLYSLKETGRSAEVLKRFSESAVNITVELLLMYAIRGLGF